MNQTLKNKCALVTGGSRTSEPPSSNVWPGKFCDFGTGRGEPHSWLRRCYQPPPPFANPLPARVPASAPRKVPIYLRLPRSVGMGDSRSAPCLKQDRLCSRAAKSKESAEEEKINCVTRAGLAAALFFSTLHPSGGLGDRGVKIGQPAKLSHRQQQEKTAEAVI